jgi:hypothetical protein
MYFHAFISSETGAAQKYAGCEITDRSGQQVGHARVW